MTNQYIVIEKLHPCGGIRITTESAVGCYLGLSLKDAESRFREENNLKGKRLQRIMKCTN